MFNKVSGIIALSLLYKVIKSDWTNHPFYIVGIIDNNGNKLVSKDEMDKDQLAVYTNYNVFTYKVKRILEKNPVFKFSIISAIASSIFLKESEESEIDFVEYNGELAISFTGDKYHSMFNAVEVLTENGVVLTGKENIKVIEDINNTTGMAEPELPLNKKKKKPNVRKALKAIKKY